MSVIEIYQKWTSTNLVLRILCGLVIGIVLGIFVPGLPYIGLLGNGFVWALKAIAPILIMMIVITSLMNRSEGLGSRFGSVIFLYIFSSMLAAIVAVIVFFIFPVSIDLQPTEPILENTDFEQFITDLLQSILTNPVTALADSNYLAVLFWALVIGILAKPLASDNVKEICSNVCVLFMKIIALIIQFAPFGILGIIYQSLSDHGADVLADYGMLIIVLTFAMFLVCFVSNPAIVAVITRGMNPYPLLMKCIRKSGVMAFFTRSSAANVPVNLELCEELGLDRNFYSTSIPLGATINMCGAAVTISILALTASYSIGMDVTIAEAIALCIITTLCAVGCSGIAGGSLLVVPLACSILGVPPEIGAAMIGVGFAISVVNDSVETAVNSSSDVFFTAAVDMRHRKKKEKETASE